MRGNQVQIDFSLQNIGNNKVADLISEAMVKKFKFIMKTDLISDALRTLGSNISASKHSYVKFLYGK